MPPAPLEPVLNQPISPRENLLLAYQGKKPYWIPTGGFLGGELVAFRPRINGDNIANHQVWDGGPEYDYTGMGASIRSSWFGMEWVSTDIGGGMPHPDRPIILDITRWEDYVTFPNLDLMDWESLRKQNIGYLGTNKMNQLGIQSGLWERMMNLMDVSEACIALVDEDLKPHAHRFLDAYCDFLIDYVRRVKQFCDIHSLMVHEDWAHQRGAFMSPATAQEMLLPYVKRMVDWCHQNGMIYEIHMCGAVEDLIPLFFEAKIDTWAMIQPLLYDVPKIVKQYKNERFVWGMTAPDITVNFSDDEMRAAVQAFIDEFAGCNYTLSFMNMDPDFPGYHPKLKETFYELSRLANQDEA
jgi:hypothetical protein